MLLSPADDRLEFVLTLRQLEMLTANVCDTPGWKRIGPRLGVLALLRSSFPTQLFLPSSASRSPRLLARISSANVHVCTRA